MALSIDGSTSNSAVSTSSQGTLTLTTANAGDIIIVTAGSETDNAGVATVTSVTAGGLTFAKRASNQHNFNTNYLYNSVEVWWAYASSVVTGVITVKWDKQVDDACIGAFGVTGFTGTDYITNPWDADAALPVTAQSTLSGAGSSAIISGISIDSSRSLGMTFWGSVGSGGLTTPGAGWTQLLDLGNPGAVHQYHLTVQDQVFAAAQVSITSSYGDSPGVGWVAIADALTMFGVTSVSTAATTVLSIDPQGTNVLFHRYEVIGY